MNWQTVTGDLNEVCQKFLSYSENQRDFPHQIGAVNPLSFMNCKLKETKTTNFVEQLG